MPQKMSEKKIKDSLKNDTLDLSYCELQEVPVQKIVSAFPSTLQFFKIIIEFNISQEY